MNDALLTRQLTAQGLDGDEIARRVRQGSLVRLRRGAYAEPITLDDERPEDRHRRLVAGTAPMLNPQAVISHTSAAVLHGYPLWGPSLERVHVTHPSVDRSEGAQRRRLVHDHVAPLEQDELVTVAGLVVTSQARTVVDIGRSLPPMQALAVADAARRSGVTEAELGAAVRRATRWPGVRAARRTVAAASPLAESPGESGSRVRIREAGLPEPVLQHVVLDRFGRAFARSDFAWPELKTLGEFDGRIKYGRAFDPHRSIEDIVYAEKLREDAVRDLGWQVVRWIWADLYAFDPVAERLQRAFAR